MTDLILSPMRSVSLAAIDPIRTVSVIWDSLGIFGYLFIFAILVILCFLVHGWVLLGRNHSPIDFGKDLDESTREDLRELVHEGMDDATISERLFGGSAPPEGNLFFHYLKRFARRQRGREPAPSLLHATEEQHEISRIQNISYTAKFLSMVLPAIGLLGTLIGMFNAFFGTDFTKGAELSITMQKLMHDFALALFTTIIAVVLKIAADLFNHFTLEVYVAKLRGQLHRLRSLLLDLYAEEPAVSVTSSDPAPSAPVERDDTEQEEPEQEEA